MLEAMKSLRDKMQSMKKASEAEVVKTSASLSKAGPTKQPDPTTTQTSHPTRHLTTWMLFQWTRTYMVLHFLQNSLNVSSPTLLPNTGILNPTTTRNNLKRCVQKQRNTQTRKNTRFGPQVLFTVIFFRGRSVLCPHQKVYQTSTKGSF